MPKTIYKGLPVTINCIIRSESTGEPIDLNGFTTITACFTQFTASTLSIIYDSAAASGITVTGETLGKLTISITASQTNLLLEGEQQDFFVKQNESGSEVLARFSKQINVRDVSC